MKKHLLFTTFVALASLVIVGCSRKPEQGTLKVNPVWEKLLTLYRKNENVRHLVFVQCLDNSMANVQIYKKDSLNFTWTIVCETDGVIGRCGWSAEKREGDGKTPTGDFGIITAFGLKANPKTNLPYIDITDSVYAVDTDTRFYNKIVNNRGVQEGEHMWDYSPEYNYGIFLDYNKECFYGKGSAVFVHSKGVKPYTSGCVAVDEIVIRMLLQHCSPADRICIYPLLVEEIE